MKKTFDYQAEAELCLEAAEKTSSPENRKFLLAMARVWANLAGGDEPREDRSAPPLGTVDAPDHPLIS